MILASGGSRFGSVERKHVSALTVVALGVFLAHPARAVQLNSAATNPAVAQYIRHLAELQTVVASCQKLRSAEACDPAQVGSNDHVPWAAAGAIAEREINYDWLRALLSEAGKPETGKDASTAAAGAINSASVAKTPAASVDTQLTEARQRLAADAQQIAQPSQPTTADSAQRRALAALLAGRDYQGVAQTTVRERFLEWLGNVLDELLGRLMRFGARSPWIGFVVRALFLGGLCLLLVWLLVRMERRSRIRLLAEDGAGLAAAPSARGWQHWLRDAQAMAGQGLWREGIHFLYWAAIARLEAGHLWPADRARTPREYLRLLPAADPRRAGLTVLTGTFERTWYGGRQAGAADYQSAMRRAAELGVE